jgi:hypothetical protein
MKKTITLVAVLFTSCNFFAQAQDTADGQNIYTYGYDNAGNRVIRQLLVITGMATNDDPPITENMQTRSGDIAVSLYPNPTSAQVEVDVDYQEVPEQALTMSLHDFNGRQLESKVVHSVHHQIDMRPYAQGIYYLKITSKDGLIVKEVKILKQ